MNLAALPGAPFDVVLDVGGNIGEFAEAAADAWPAARIVSFEPIPGAAEASRIRSKGRWQVITTAVGDETGERSLWFCANQPTASTMQQPGTARRRHFDIRDVHERVSVPVTTLDDWLVLPIAERSRVLVKVDVEGYEGHVLRGARRVLSLATTVVCEVQQDPSIFLGSPPPYTVDYLLRERGLSFAGLADVFCSPDGDVLQFDGVWTRDDASWLKALEQTAVTASGLPAVEKPQ